MFNVLLDELPQEWNGYQIDTDFQTGIQISQCLNDSSLSEYERLAVACNLLYLDMPDNINTAIEGITWFLNGWNHDNHTPSKSEESVMDFDIDQWRIYSAFQAQYGINLNMEPLHWFVFMGLLTNLEECAYTRVINIRQKKLTAKMDKEEKKAYEEAKRIYAIKNGEKQAALSVKEKEAVNEFLKYAKKKE